MLKDVDFTGANLDETMLEGADLRGSRFVGADLTSVSLSNARLEEADLRGASFENMAGAFSGVMISPPKSVDAIQVRHQLKLHEKWVESGGKEGQRADFTGQSLAGLDLSGRCLDTICFAHANLKGIVLRGAVLAACDFSEANLRQADLSRCDLRGANLKGAILDDARLDEVRTGTLPETGIRTVFPDGFAPRHELA
jgi:uncharacterized protein YjbI with pentapeptide repeats